MENKVYNYIKKYNMINEGDRVLAGVSGGADSMCLLLVLLKLADRLGAKIFAVHVNHCLRGEDSDEDAEFVRKFCENNGIECIVRNVDVKSLVKTEGLSEEEAARLMQEKFMDKCRGILAIARKKKNVLDYKEIMDYRHKRELVR